MTFFKTNFALGILMGLGAFLLPNPANASTIEEDAAAAVKVAREVLFVSAFAEFSTPAPATASTKPSAEPVNLLSQVAARVPKSAIWIDALGIVHIYDARNPNNPVHRCTQHQIPVACPKA